MVDFQEGLIRFVAGVILFLALHTGPIGQRITQNNWWVWAIGAAVIFIFAKKISEKIKID